MANNRQICMANDNFIDCAYKDQQPNNSFKHSKTLTHNKQTTSLKSVIQLFRTDLSTRVLCEGLDNRKINGFIGIS